MTETDSPFFLDFASILLTAVMHSSYIDDQG